MKRLFLYIIFAVAMSASLSATNDIDHNNRDIISQAKVSTSARSTQGHIVLSSAEEKPITFQIYSIIGQLVKSVTVASASEVSIEMPRGYYIVKCEKWTKQVIVK